MNYAMSFHGSPAALPIFPRLRASTGQVRCECQVCGSHAFSTPGAGDSGRCGNCASTALRPLEGELTNLHTLPAH